MCKAEIIPLSGEASGPQDGESCGVLTLEEARFLSNVRDLAADDPGLMPVLLSCMQRSASGDETAVADFAAYLEQTRGAAVVNANPQ